MTDLDQLPQDFVQTFSRHIKFVKFIGVDIFGESRSHFLKRFGRLIIFYTMIVSTLFGQFLFIFLSHRTGVNFLHVINAIPGTLLTTQDLAKLIIITLKRNEIRKVILEIAELWPLNEAGEKLKTLTDWTTRLRMFQRFYYIVGYVAIFFYLLVPITVTIYTYIVESKTIYLFPLDTYFFYFLPSHFAYAVTYVYICILCGSIYLCIYIASDFILTSLIFDVSGLLAVLQKEFENLEPQNEDELLASNDCSAVKDIVKRHQKLLRVVKNLNRIFAPLLFTQVTFSSLIICCFGFLTIVGKDLIKNLLATFGIILAMFNFCWSGQLLSDSSTDIAEAAYQTMWYKRGNEYRKYILIIIARAQTPCVLSALGFSDVTLTTLSRILSASWSYLSLLNQMYSDMSGD